jgi:hypothetical protein
MGFEILKGPKVKGEAKDEEGEDSHKSDAHSFPLNILTNLSTSSSLRFIFSRKKE